jgi:hypothetical protein
MIRSALEVEAKTFPVGKHDDTIDTLANVTKMHKPRFKKRRKHTRVLGWRNRTPAGVREFLR